VLSIVRRPKWSLTPLFIISPVTGIVTLSSKSIVVYHVCAPLVSKVFTNERIRLYSPCVGPHSKPLIYQTRVLIEGTVMACRVYYWLSWIGGVLSIELITGSPR
jgi:hypothetical protein